MRDRPAILVLEGEKAGFSGRWMSALRRLAAEDPAGAEALLLVAQREPRPKLDPAALARLIPSGPPGVRRSAGRLGIIKSKLKSSRKERFGVDPDVDADDRRRLRNARKAERAKS